MHAGVSLASFLQGVRLGENAFCWRSSLSDRCEAAFSPWKGLTGIVTGLGTTAGCGEVPPNVPPWMAGVEHCNVSQVLAMPGAVTCTACVKQSVPRMCCSHVSWAARSFASLKCSVGV